MKRIFAAVATGSVLFAGAFGFAQSQSFASTGIAAQGSATAASCAADLNVLYVQTAGQVTGVKVIQAPAGNCDLVGVHVGIQTLANVVLGSGTGSVNGAAIPVGPISNVAGIDHAVVTITDE